MNNLSRHKLVAVAGLALLLALAAACGGGRDSSSRTAAPPGAGSADGGQAVKSIDSGAAPAQGDAQTRGAPSDSGQDGALPLPSTLDRKMIMVSTVSLTAGDVARAFEDVGNVAAAEGGFIASSSFGHDGDRQTASVTIRVPADKYGDALIRIRKLGDVVDEQSSSNDVTEEYTDLQSRLTNLRAVEQQYVQLLGRAANIGEVLQVQDRLNQTRAEIEQVQGRINLLDHQTDLATITVHLDPPPAKPETKPARNPLEVAADAFQASLVVLRGIAAGGLAVVAFSWWLAPLALAGWYLGRRQFARHGADRRAVGGER